ncbi:MAG: WD40 repeat domain-containing protein [Thermoanaerobaculia bacterium]
MRIKKPRLWLAVLAGSLLAIAFASRSALFDNDSAPNPNPSLVARLQNTTAGHSKAVWQVAFSPDGQYLASGSVDHTVQLRRMPEGRIVHTLTQPQGITSIAFSPDGQYLASGSYDERVRVWRVGDGALVRTLTAHKGTVWSVAFSPDGHRLASSGEDKTVRIWRVRDGAALQSLVGHTLNVWSVAFSPDGQWLASGSFDKTAKLWRVDTGALVQTLSGHSEAVVELAFSPDSELLATGSDDSSIKLWRVNDGTLVNTLTGVTCRANRGSDLKNKVFTPPPIPPDPRESRAAALHRSDPRPRSVCSLSRGADEGANRGSDLKNKVFRRRALHSGRSRQIRANRAQRRCVDSIRSLRPFTFSREPTAAALNPIARCSLPRLVTCQIAPGCSSRSGRAMKGRGEGRREAAGVWAGKGYLGWQNRGKYFIF